MDLEKVTNRYECIACWKKSCRTLDCRTKLPFVCIHERNFSKNVANSICSSSSELWVPLEPEKCFSKVNYFESRHELSNGPPCSPDNLVQYNSNRLMLVLKTLIDWNNDEKCEEYIFQQSSSIVTDNKISYLCMKNDTPDYVKIPCYICERLVKPNEQKIEIKLSNDKFETELLCITSELNTGIIWYKNGEPIYKNLQNAGSRENSFFPKTHNETYWQGMYSCEVIEIITFSRTISKPIFVENKVFQTFIINFKRNFFGDKTDMCDKWRSDLQNIFRNTNISNNVLVSIIQRSLIENRMQEDIISHLYLNESRTEKHEKKSRSLIEENKIGENFFHKVNETLSSKEIEDWKEKHNVHDLILKRIDSCAKETTHEPGSRKSAVTWPSTKVNNSSSMKVKCFSGEKTFSRNCSGDFINGPYWTKVYGACTKEINVTVDLWKLSLEDVTADNVENISRHLKNLTSKTEHIHSKEMVYISETLRNIAELSSFSSEVLHNVFGALNNVLEPVPLNKTSNRFYNSTTNSRILTAFEYIIRETDMKQNESVQFCKNHICLRKKKIQRMGTDSLLTIGMAMKTKGRELTDIFQNDSIFFREFDAAIIFPETLISDNVNESIDFLVYQRTELFNSSRENCTTQNVSQPVISAAIGRQHVSELGTSIKVVFHLDQNSTLVQACGFWDTNDSDWSTEGCFYNGTEGERHVCLCDHLTNFAVIVTIGDLSLGKADQIALDLITYIGCSLSATGSLLTIMAFSLFRRFRQGLGRKVLVNLSGALLGALVVFLTGIDRNNWGYGCKVVAALLHYFLLAAFAWMLVEAVLQYLRFVKVLGVYVPRFMLKAMIAAWGIPAIIVGIAMATTINSSYSSNRHCWLGEGAFYYAFLLPLSVVLVVNIVMFMLIIYALYGRRQSKAPDEKRVALLRIRTSFCTLFLLGLTWTFGYVAMNNTHLAFQYIFSVCNSLQGFVIFIFTILQEKEPR